MESGTTFTCLSKVENSKWPVAHPSLYLIQQIPFLSFCFPTLNAAVPFGNLANCSSLQRVTICPSLCLILQIKSVRQHPVPESPCCLLLTRWAEYPTPPPGFISCSPSGPKLLSSHLKLYVHTMLLQPHIPHSVFAFTQCFLIVCTWQTIPISLYCSILFLLPKWPFPSIYLQTSIHLWSSNLM